ncbi:membrane fusion protein (multidrug efflux system) [Constrictibacter sp. MBR-5]|jgi:membrane fusion protein (multidrug efflux system)|uniref:HlyD family secretion protein n=1 Tax=Constrictibacter sp. MBR-5 TaxID=3156467 RepID=UPI003392828D
MANQATAPRVVDRSDGAEDRPTAPPPAPPSTRRRSGLLRPRNLIVAAVALIAIVFGAMEVHQRLTHVYEYDARVTSDMITVSSRVAGWITELPVTEGQSVPEGGIIAQIDTRLSSLRLEALEAERARLAADRERLMAQRRMTEEMVAARSQTRGSTLDATAANRASLRAEVGLARRELERATALYERRVVSNSAVDRARSNLERLEGELKRAEAQIGEARGSLKEARVENAQLGVIDGEIAMLDAQATALESEMAQQRIDLEDRSIRSPIDVVVNRLFVEAGEYVSEGQRIALIHDPNRLWIEANIKETSIRQLKPGQPVAITVDAYPDHTFKGTVERIGHSTTANFALLPTPNPSGNFTKITQRIPVRVTIDDPPVQLSPGMMVEVNIDVRE